MPHIIVKRWPGHSEQQKQQLVDAITQDAMRIRQSTNNPATPRFDING